MSNKKETPSKKEVHARANWLRAAVLGANDGIVSVAGLVVGVAGATSDKHIILVAGIAGILAGAFSMAAGEYISVSTQRDIEKEHHKKQAAPDEDEPFTNPWHAAIASAVSFFVGSILPLAAVLLPIGAATIPVTFAAVIVALILTGYLSAYYGGTNKRRAIVRVVLGGVIAMVVTYLIGTLFGVSVG
jgi:VIT1/CCC1 family predicted Fe2+/Mn2+ transporter